MNPSHLLDRPVKQATSAGKTILKTVLSIVGFLFMFGLGSSGFGLGLVFIFAVLKSFHIIDWSNLWIASPLWIPLLFNLTIVLLGVVTMIVIKLVEMANTPLDKLDKHGHPVRLRWWDWMWMYSPIVFFFSPGLLPIAAGLGNAYLNGRIFRSRIPTIVKYSMTGGFTVIFLTLYCAVHAVFRPHK